MLDHILDFVWFIVIIICILGGFFLLGQCTMKESLSNRYYACLSENQQMPAKERKEMCTISERK